jgi:hypothetical protein
VQSCITALNQVFKHKNSTLVSKRLHYYHCGIALDMKW